MLTARQLVELKGSDVWTIGPDHKVFEAISLMAEKDIGSLLVLDVTKLVGIITERHYARNVILKGKASPDTPVSEIMERRVVCARPEYTVEQCMDLMTRFRVSHLPVLDKGKVVGLVSIGDLVKSIIDDKNFVIAELEHYISGERAVH